MSSLLSADTCTTESRTGSGPSSPNIFFGQFPQINCSFFLQSLIDAADCNPNRQKGAISYRFSLTGNSLFSLTFSKVVSVISLLHLKVLIFKLVQAFLLPYTCFVFWSFGFWMLSLIRNIRFLLSSPSRSRLFDFFAIMSDNQLSYQNCVLTIRTHFFIDDVYTLFGSFRGTEAWDKICSQV